jgi:hypothetical protein
MDKGDGQQERSDARQGDVEMQDMWNIASQECDNPDEAFEYIRQ